MLLGATGVPPIEMADAYATIARIGSRLPLRTIRFVTNDRGKVVTVGDDVKPVQVFPARDAFILANVMKGPVDRGTANIVRRMGLKKIAAGKTGTTNDKKDAWFIGFTPQTLALTWVGFDDNTPTGLAGGEAAAPIWARYMIAVTAAQPNVDFAAPAGVVMAQMDETSGGLATPNCPQNLIVTDAFKAGTEPTTPCPIHSPQAAPPPALDQFGNPITLGGMPTTTEGSVTTTTDVAPPLPPDSTLTGGVFRTDTGAPPATTEPSRRERPREQQPPPTDTGTTPPLSTSTSAPPTTTSTSPP
jgi:membrane carboxypeptidase/penicillin-binding protein